MFIRFNLIGLNRWNWRNITIHCQQERMKKKQPEHIHGSLCGYGENRSHADMPRPKPKWKRVRRRAFGLLISMAIAFHYILHNKLNACKNSNQNFQLEFFIFAIRHLPIRDVRVFFLLLNPSTTICWFFACTSPSHFINTLGFCDFDPAISSNWTECAGCRAHCNSITDRSYSIRIVNLCSFSC